MEASWASLGDLLGPLGASWGFLGSLGSILAHLGGLLGLLGGPSWGGLRASWRRLGEFLGTLGGSWRYLGAFFTWMLFCDRFLLDFMMIFRYVEHVQKASGITKIVVLSLHATFT